MTGYWTKTGNITICYIFKVLFIGTKIYPECSWTPSDVSEVKYLHIFHEFHEISTFFVFLVTDHNHIM
jgi:hypothetical protein